MIALTSHVTLQKLLSPSESQALYLRDRITIVHTSWDHWVSRLNTLVHSI